MYKGRKKMIKNGPIVANKRNSIVKKAIYIFFKKAVILFSPESFSII